jgi:hypothetical protein
MPRITLFNANNGLSTLVDAGTGLRAKSWLEELPIWLKESVEPAALAGIGLGRLANFPSVIDGSKMAVRPMGEALQVPAFAGVEIFECIPNTQVVGIGSGASAAIPGAAALTIGDITNLNYATAGAASGTVGVPVNGLGYPAFLTSDAENYNLAATDGILSVRINGVLYTANVGVGGATTAEQVITAILAAGWPCGVSGVIVGGAIIHVRLSALACGGSSTTMQAVVTAGTAGAVIFAVETGALRFGYNGPLNDMRLGLAANGAQMPGIKVGHRVLPGSVTLTTTIAGPLADSATDNRAGILSNLAGTSLGTVNYVTGAVVMAWAGNVVNLTAVTARFRSLWPVDLFRPVRVNEHNGGQFAIRLLP